MELKHWPRGVLEGLSYDLGMEARFDLYILSYYVGASKYTIPVG